MCNIAPLLRQELATGRSGARTRASWPSLAVKTSTPRRGDFATTRWSVVLDARAGADEAARDAMTELVEAYYSPLYAFARRRGHDADEAGDLVQGFFVRMLETDGFGGARRERGRFRSYLLGAFKHFLGHERERSLAAKRGGGVAALSLDLVDAESFYDPAAVDEMTPERVFERRWALTLLDLVLGRLRQEWDAAGRGAAFERLKGFLTGDGADAPQRDLARELDMSEGALRVAVHRLPRRFGKLLRAEVAATVERPEEVEDELRYLLAALRR